MSDNNQKISAIRPVFSTSPVETPSPAGIGENKTQRTDRRHSPSALQPIKVRRTSKYNIPRLFNPQKLKGIKTDWGKIEKDWANREKAAAHLEGHERLLALEKIQEEKRHLIQQEETKNNILKMLAEHVQKGAQPS